LGLAKLNVQADSLATLGLKQSNTMDINLLTNKAILLINNKKVASKYIKHLRDNFSSIEMYSYYQEKYKWTDHIMSRVWWDACDMSIKNFSPKKQIMLQKFNHDHIA
jgi:hypothetical protein